MTGPFSRPSTGDSHRLEKTCGEDVECKFCATLRRARELELFDPLPELCSPLTPGVQRVNLSYSDDGQMLRASLGHHWERMFEHLTLVGEGLVMTRNQAAIVGRRMTFPELAFTTQAIKGASECGGLWFDFRALSAARAVHLRSESGHIFGIEFLDARGHTIHRFTATSSSNLDVFLGWVRLHQACSEDRRTYSTGGEEDVAVGYPKEQLSGFGAIVSIMTACYERGLRLRATVHNNAVIQRACFTPQSLQSIGDWWFACDDRVGLHFCPGQLTEAKTESSPDVRDPRLLLYGQAGEGKPALVLQADDERQAVAWGELLHTLV
jgi:hypothetical protein